MRHSVVAAITSDMLERLPFNKSQEARIINMNFYRQVVAPWMRTQQESVLCVITTVDFCAKDQTAATAEDFLLVSLDTSNKVIC